MAKLTKKSKPKVVVWHNIIGTVKSLWHNKYKKAARCPAKANAIHLWEANTLLLHDGVRNDNVNTG